MTNVTASSIFDHEGRKEEEKPRSYTEGPDSWLSRSNSSCFFVITTEVHGVKRKSSRKGAKIAKDAKGSE